MQHHDCCAFDGVFFWQGGIQTRARYVLNAFRLSKKEYHGAKCLLDTIKFIGRSFTLTWQEIIYKIHVNQIEPKIEGTKEVLGGA